MEWEQERYDLKRKLDAELSNRRFFEDEVDVLQKELEENKMKVDTLMKLLKGANESLGNLEMEWRNKVESLQAALDAEKKFRSYEVLQLKSDIGKLHEEKVTSSDAAVSEVQTLKEKNDELTLQAQSLETKVEKLSEDNGELQKVIEEMFMEKSNLEEILSSKREILADYEEKNVALQGDLALLKVENDTLKTSSSKSGKGNSVFAECDDNRKALKKNLDALAEKYKDLKKQLKNKSLEISKLQCEKSTLMKTIEELSTKQYSLESPLIESYKTRIKDLESQMQQMIISQDIVSQRNVTDCNDYKALDSLFGCYRKEIQSLKETVEKQSEALFLKSELLYSTRRELQLLKVKYAYEQNEKLKLQEESNMKVVENGKTVEDDDDILDAL